MAAIRRLRAQQYRDAPREATESTEPAAGSGPAVPLHVLSFNVWFAYPETFSKRMEEVARLADVGASAVSKGGVRTAGGGTPAVRPSVLALQERTTLAIHSAPSLLTQLYSTGRYDRPA